MKETKWCESCERNEPVSEEILRTWRTLWIAPRGPKLEMIKSAHPVDLEHCYVPKNAKFVCGDEGAMKLTSRFLTTRSLEPLRTPAADSPMARSLFESTNAIREFLK